MPWDKKIFLNDFRQVAKDLPVSFRFNRFVYENAVFQVGASSLNPMAGGVDENPGDATLTYALADFPSRRKLPVHGDTLEVFWHEQWIEYKVNEPRAGHVLYTMPLIDPNGTR